MKKVFKKQMITNLILSVAFIYAFTLLFLFIFQRKFIYFPQPSRPDLADTVVSDMTEVTFTTSDGLDLYAWYEQAQKGNPTILYLQGNAGDLSHRQFKIRPFINDGYGVFIFSYRGYGGNPGTPTEEGLYKDARAALDYLEKKGVSGRKVVLYGESLGTGVAVQMATEMAPYAVVLEAPFKSIPAAAQDKFPVFPARHLLKDHYDSYAKIAQIDAPVFILHGTEDFIMPHHHSLALIEKATPPRDIEIYQGANHFNLFDFGAYDDILRFLEQVKREEKHRKASQSE